MRAALAAATGDDDRRRPRRRPSAGDGRARRRPASTRSRRRRRGDRRRAGDRHDQGVRGRARRAHARPLAAVGGPDARRSSAAPPCERALDQDRRGVGAATDDASLVEAMGGTVRVVPAPPREPQGHDRARPARGRDAAARALSAAALARALGLWRAGPVAGHGLRLRRLRLRGVSRATRSRIVFARPGSIAVLRSVSATPSRPQLLWRAGTPVLSARVSRRRGLPPRWRANGCARVSSTPSYAGRSARSTWFHAEAQAPAGPAIAAELHGRHHSWCRCRRVLPSGGSRGTRDDGRASRPSAESHGTLVSELCGRCSCVRSSDRGDARCGGMEEGRTTAGRVRRCAPWSWRRISKERR